MKMGPLQIASEYRTGRDKTKTIKALAELNACTQREIAEILQEQGEELPGHWVEKLKNPVQRRRKDKDGETDARPMTAGQLSREVMKAIFPEGGPVPEIGAAQREADCHAGAAAPARNDSEALSLDEIRQAALGLIANSGPGEAERFQGYARGIAALVENLEGRVERRRRGK